ESPMIARTSCKSRRARRSHVLPGIQAEPAHLYTSRPARGDQVISTAAQNPLPVPHLRSASRRCAGSPSYLNVAGRYTEHDGKTTAVHPAWPGAIRIDLESPADIVR